MERTLVLVKPDGVQRGLVGRILGRFEDKGLKIAALKLIRMTPEIAGRMYSVHEGKDFYGALVEFMTSGPIVAMVLEGNGATAVVRAMMGTTFGPQAAPGTIRGDFGMSMRYNLVHGSDSPESAAREIPVLFGPQEIVDYPLSGAEWVYASKGGEAV